MPRVDLLFYNYNGTKKIPTRDKKKRQQVFSFCVTESPLLYSQSIGRWTFKPEKKYADYADFISFSDLIAGSEDLSKYMSKPPTLKKLADIFVGEMAEMAWEKYYGKAATDQALEK
jgi:hypothetical protein